MLTRFIKIQLVLFTILTIIAIVVLGWYYLRVPCLVGIGTSTSCMPICRAPVGLYATANVTYRGTQIGKVTAVEPTETGRRGHDEHRQPLQDPGRCGPRTCIQSRRSASSSWTWCRPATRASTTATGRPSRQLGTVPSEVGPALDSANEGLAVLPKEKIDALLTETAQAVGGLGPALQRLVDSTTNDRQGFRDNLPQVNDIIAHSAPILDSQVSSGDAIEQWSRNLNILARSPPSRTRRCAAACSRPRRRSIRFRGVQRCARRAAADAGEPRGRHRHAQAL